MNARSDASTLLYILKVVLKKRGSDYVHTSHSAGARFTDSCDRNISQHSVELAVRDRRILWPFFAPFRLLQLQDISGEAGTLCI